MNWIALYYREGDASAKLTDEQIAAGAGPDPAPARAFLNALPLSPRAGLRATIVAVRDRPPPSFPTGSQAWRLMHKPAKKGEVDMSGIFEARDRHQRKLYRLFCVLDSRAPEHGLAAPTLVMLSGGQERRRRGASGGLPGGAAAGRPLLRHEPPAGDPLRLDPTAPRASHSCYDAVSRYGGNTMAKEQLKRAGGVFEADLARDLEDPEFARFYALKLAKINAIADILDAIEAARQEQHLSKAEIGRRIDRKPSAVSRLLGGTEQNPTWDTLIDLAYAVDLELEVKVKKAPKRRAAPEPVKVLRAA